MYNVLDVAKYIIEQSLQKNKKDEIYDSQISNLELQLLLFLCQIIYYKKTNKKLFNEELVASKIGPKNLEVYYAFCGFGSLPISISLDPTVELKVMDRLIIDPIIENFVRLCKSDFWASTKINNGPEMSACRDLYNKYGEIEIPIEYIIKINGDEIYEKYKGL